VYNRDQAHCVLTGNIVTSVDTRGYKDIKPHLRELAETIIAGKVTAEAIVKKHTATNSHVIPASHFTKEKVPDSILKLGIKDSSDPRTSVIVAVAVNGLFDGFRITVNVVHFK
jgi:hypothetical protein